MDEKTVKNCTAHAWELLAEDSFGEMDYSSYGGGAEPYVIRTWVCRNCGAIVIAEEAPEKCPVCAHPKAYFEIKRDNY